MKERKSKRTLSDLITEGFGTESDILMLRNILIDGNILIQGDRSTGLPLLLAIICELCRDEIGVIPKVIYESDYDYDYKVSKATKEKRVIFQGVTSINTLYDAEGLAKKDCPIIVCLSNLEDVALDYSYFDYVIKMRNGNPSGIESIAEAVI